MVAEMGGPESVQTFFSNLHCIIFMEIDNLRYIMTGYYCILEEQLFPEFQLGVTHPHELWREN